MSQHIFIIGGTRGIGRATAQRLRQDGWNVSILSRALPDDGARVEGCRYFAHDILADSGLEPVLERVREAAGPLHGLAFFQRHRGKDGSWEGNLAATLTATRRVIEAALPFLCPQGDKSIVLLSSIASHAVADEQDEGYHAAKTGLVGLGRYYAFKLGPQGVRVNCVAPGTLLKEESQRFFLEKPELHDLYRRITPLRRMGTAAEIANVVRFLLSPEASFLTGQELVVDGGVGLQWQESLARALNPSL